MKNPILPTGKPRSMSTPKTTEAAELETTGRYIISFREGGTDDGRRLLQGEGFSVASADDSADGVLREEEAAGADVLLFPRVGLALLSGEAGQYERVRALDVGHDPNSPVLSVSPETVTYGAAGSFRRERPPADLTAYLKGYREAVDRLAEDVLAEGIDSPLSLARDESPLFREDVNTWGLQVTRVPDSRFTGSGVRLAVLDTGLDLNHRDFRQRVAARNTASFVTGTDAQDRVGHGTHCAGIACGPLRAAEGPRYGVAPEVEIFAAKVINDLNVGAQAWTIAGVEWALKQRCHVVSMSIEEKVFPNTPFNPNYETMGRRALEGGMLIVAAAGNFSNRASSFIMPVSAPANSPSILAVGAVGPFGQGLRISNFSNGGINPNASEVDIAAPGESIHSSLLPDRYGRRSGTSMAAPFVAGIAALFAQADPSARGRGLGQLLQRFAFNIGARPEDAGAGLVQAPL